MRRLFPALLPVALLAVPPALGTKPPLPTLAEAENRYLQAWDLEAKAPGVPVVAKADQAKLRWLVSAATQSLPANPFPRGSADWREAEAVRRFLQAPPQDWNQGLKSLPLTLGGTYTALWNWGRLKVRQGLVDRELREAWEDRLLLPTAPLVVRGLALRHALCFALAGGDQDRFRAVKETQQDDFEGEIADFQNAFGLLGAPAPVVRVWRLPDLAVVQGSMAQLGGARVWIDPDPGKGLPELAPGTIWVAPTRDGVQPPSLDTLEGPSLQEAQALAPRLRSAGRTAYLAATREAFENYALVYFPIQITLDGDGTVQRIQMGDAALAKEP